MNIEHIIDQAIAAKVGLSLQGERLALKAAGPLPPSLRAAIEAHKDEIKAYLRDQAALPRSGLPAIARRAGTGPAELSFAQQRLYFMDRLDAGGAQYNMLFVLTLAGAFDRPALQRAVAALTRRHEILRTCFREFDGRVQQVVQEAAEPALAVLDLSGQDAATQRLAVKQAYQQFAAGRFDLAQDPMIRALPVVLSARETMVVVCVHHIASDGASTDIVARELSALYDASRAGGEGTLAPLPVQYADFATWQRELLSDAAVDERLAFWKGVMAGAPPLHGLPLDRARPARQGQRGRLHRRQLDADLAQSLKAACAQHNVTMFMLLQTAFAVLLSRYGDETDIVMGTPVSGRSHQELEPLVGLFLNNLVLRCRVDGNPRFVDLLATNRANILEGYARQDLPFDVLVDRMDVARSLNHHPLFQVKINFTTNETEDGPSTSLGLTQRDIDPAVPTAGMDLALEINVSRTGISTAWIHDADLWDAPTIEAMGESFEVLLRGIVAQPQANVLSLPLVSEAARQRLVVDWNRTRRDVPDACVHELFERAARAHPNRTALAFDGHAMTYAQLNALSNRLARHLAARGVGPGVLVGLYMERSLELFVGLLGILKAGAAYVPIDIDHPEGRIAHILADARIGHVVTLGEHASDAALADVRTTCIDPGLRDAMFASCAADDLARAAVPGLAPSSLACVIYTSGSTGGPKGALIEHRGMVNLAQFVAREFDITAADQVVQFASISFDASNWEWMMALTAGATLHLIRKADRLDAEAFGAFLARERISVATLPPAYLRTMDLQALAGLRVLVTAGEALEPLLADELRAILGAGRLYNAYGPTEATVCGTTFRVDGPWSANVPIGRAIDNARCYVVNDAMALAPVGALGELCIAGAGIARGYLNQERLTADKFLQDPFTAPAERLYRTGDVARWRHDGQIEFIGRRDSQVKINGLRIELGEIEQHLNACASVHEAVAAACRVPGEADQGLRRLVAYVVPKDAEGPTPAPDDEADEADASAVRGRLVDECTTALRAKLPPYMVPSVFVVMRAIPLTINGKVDRAALPEPTEADVVREAYQAPGDDIEAVLCEVWQGALGLQDVSVNDNFFRLGGDSIVSIQIVSRARNKGLSLTVRQIFEHQTIARLAKVVGVDVQAPVAREAATGTMPLLPIQREFLQGDATDRHHYNQSFLLETPPDFDAAQLDAMVEALHGRHDALRLRFGVDAGEWTARFVEATPDVLARSRLVEDLAGCPAGEVGVVLAQRANQIQRSLDIEHGPVFRAAYFRLPGGQGRLLLVLHHLVVDGVSWRILLSDLELAHRQLATQGRIELGERTGSVQAWGRRLGEYAGSKALQSERAFWNRQLAAADAHWPFRAPALRPDGDAVSSIHLRLGREDTGSLLGEANDGYRTTTIELLLAALLDAVRETTGRSTVRVTLEGHGREDLFPDLDCSEAIGWFTATYPLVLSAGATDGLGEVIKSVKEQYRATPRHGIGFGVLRHLAADPLPAADGPDLIFNYLGQFDGTLNAQGAFAPAREGSGEQSSPRRARHYGLSVNGMVIDGRLEFSATWAADQLEAEQATAFMRGLLASIERCVVACKRAILNRCDVGQLRLPATGEAGADFDNEGFEL